MMQNATIHYLMNYFYFWNCVSINTYHVFQSTIKIYDTFKADTYSPIVHIYLKGFLKYSVLISVSVIKKTTKIREKNVIRCSKLKSN